MDTLSNGLNGGQVQCNTSIMDTPRSPLLLSGSNIRFVSDDIYIYIWMYICVHMNYFPKAVGQWLKLCSPFIATFDNQNVRAWLDI